MSNTTLRHTRRPGIIVRAKTTSSWFPNLVWKSICLFSASDRKRLWHPGVWLMLQLQKESRLMWKCTLLGLTKDNGSTVLRLENDTVEGSHVIHNIQDLYRVVKSNTGLVLWLDCFIIITSASNSSRCGDRTGPSPSGSSKQSLARKVEAPDGAKKGPTIKTVLFARCA